MLSKSQYPTWFDTTFLLLWASCKCHSLCSSLTGHLSIVESLLGCFYSDLWHSLFPSIQNTIYFYHPQFKNYLSSLVFLNHQLLSGFKLNFSFLRKVSLSIQELILRAGTISHLNCCLYNTYMEVLLLIKKHTNQVIES